MKNNIDIDIFLGLEEQKFYGHQTPRRKIEKDFYWQESN